MMNATQKSITCCLFTSETVPAFAGDGKSAMLLAKNLTNQGHRVSLFCLNPNGALLPREEIDDVTVIRISYYYQWPINRLLFRFRFFISLLLNADFNAVWMVYGAMPGYRMILTLALLTRTKVIFRSTLWGFDDAKTLLKFPSGLINKHIFSKISGYYSLNSSFSQTWKQEFGTTKIFQSFQGVSSDWFEYDVSLGEIEELRRKLFLSEKSFVILVVGHLIKRKGFPEIISWLASINDDFVLLHLGSHEAPEWDIMFRHNMEMRANKALAEKVLGSRVRFLGRQNNTIPYYKLADVLLVASHAEGYPPNSVNEALASGLPVLTRRIPGVADAVSDGVNGCIFSDEIEFRVKLSTLMHNPTFRVELGRNAKIFARDKLPIERVVNRLEEFIQGEIFIKSR